MANSRSKTKAIEVLSYSLSYSSPIESGKPSFEGVLTLADGETFIFETQSPGLAIATGQQVNQLMGIDPDGFEFTINDASADDDFPGPPIYDVVAMFELEDGTAVTAEATDIGPSIVVSFAESLAAADGIF